MSTVCDLLWQLGTKFASVTAKEPLLAISEGHIKVRLAELALGFGWTLQEGAGGAMNGGRVADFLSLSDGRLTSIRGPRVLSLSNGSADLAVIEPMQFLLEIKARPDVGTKSQAQFQAM